MGTVVGTGDLVDLSAGAIPGPSHAERHLHPVWGRAAVMAPAPAPAGSPPTRNAGLRRRVAATSGRPLAVASLDSGICWWSRARCGAAVTIDFACQRGIGQLRALLSHVDPHLTLGQLVGRLVQDGLQRYHTGRPRPADGATSPPKRGAQEQPGVPTTPAGTIARGSTPVSAKPAAAAHGTAASAAKSVAGSHGTAPTPRPPPAHQSMPTAAAAAVRGRNGPSPAKRTGATQLNGRSRPAAAGTSGGSAQPTHRARCSPLVAQRGIVLGVPPHSTVGVAQ